MALLATILLLATCYALVSNAVRIFKKFELREGEVVRFNDMLKALPKAMEDDGDDNEVIMENQMVENMQANPTWQHGDDWSEI